MAHRTFWPPRFARMGSAGRNWPGLFARLPIAAIT